MQKVSKILKDYGFYIFTQNLRIHYILKYKSLHKVLHFYVVSFLFSFFPSSLQIPEDKWSEAPTSYM